MEAVTLFTIIGVLAGFGLAYLWFRSRRHQQPVGADVSLLQDQLNRLTDRLDDRLDKTHVAMRESLERQIKSTHEIVRDVTDRLRKIDETNQQVIGVTDELRTLQNILQNPKQRGVLGEFQLQTLLENVLPPGQYQLQYGFKDGDTVDAVIFLGDDKLLPVDSKFSLENYNRIIETKDSAERAQLTRVFRQDLKNRIDETAKYIRPDEGTLDHAFMFIPSEAIYYDLLVNKVGAVATSARDLLEYAFADKHVVIVSPTTFMAVLQTIVQGLRSLKIEEQAKEIQQRVGQLGRHLEAYDDYMMKLGKSLGTTVGHYTTAAKELKKIDKDVVKIADTTEVIETVDVDKPSFDE